jgi:cell shape-determining protein MreD
VGGVPMNIVQTILLLAAALLAVFVQAAWQLPRGLLGAQVDLLPPLVACAALTGSLPTVALLAVCGGLWFDSLSTNPLGVTVLPLLVTGVVLHQRRHLILRHEPFAQFVVGFAAGAAVPAMVVISLLSMGLNPLLGWPSLWQWLVLALAGGAATPLFIHLFGRLGDTFTHPLAATPGNDPRREIKRGRS